MMFPRQHQAKSFHLAMTKCPFFGIPFDVALFPVAKTLKEANCSFVFRDDISNEFRRAGGLEQVCGQEAHRLACQTFALRVRQ